MIFPTVIGTPFSMVLESLACGIPALALTSTMLPQELAASLISVPLTQDDITRKFIIPTDAISEQIDALLGPSELRETLSTKARQVAENYSWDRTAQRFVPCSLNLIGKKRNVTPKYPDVAFAPYYDKGQNVIKIGAMQLNSFFKQRVEEGMAQTPRRSHTGGGSNGLTVSVWGYG